MSNICRVPDSGETYFFTLVTRDRIPWLCHDLARTALRAAIFHVRQKYPFKMDACVLLPNHLHCIWTLPAGDRDYAIRWKLIKSYVTRRCGKDLMLDTNFSQTHQVGNLWQPRFLEHSLQGEHDFIQHCDYIHYNPVRHGLCTHPQEWEFSSIHRFVEQGIHHRDWNQPATAIAGLNIWDV